MDPALLKEREAFKRRALANPVVERRAKKARFGGSEQQGKGC